MHSYSLRGGLVDGRFDELFQAPEAEPSPVWSSEGRSLHLLMTSSTPISS